MGKKNPKFIQSDTKYYMNWNHDIGALGEKDKYLGIEITLLRSKSSKPAVIYPLRQLRTYGHWAHETVLSQVSGGHCGNTRHRKDTCTESGFEWPLPSKLQSLLFHESFKHSHTSAKVIIKCGVQIPYAGYQGGIFPEIYF